MNRYLADTIFRAYGSAKRVKIFKITRRRVPGMVVHFMHFTLSVLAIHHCHISGLLHRGDYLFLIHLSRIKRHTPFLQGKIDHCFFNALEFY